MGIEQGVRGRDTEKWMGGVRSNGQGSVLLLISSTYLFIHLFIFIEVYLNYNVVLITAVQQSDSVL